MRRKDWCIGAIHATAWLALTIGVQFAVRDSPSRDAYALLCAWWATLYLACLLGTTWRAVPVFLLMMAIAVAMDGGAGTQLLYHDAPAVLSTGFLGLLLLLCVLWLSPFAINAAASRLRERVLIDA